MAAVIPATSPALTLVPPVDTSRRTYSLAASISLDSEVTASHVSQSLLAHFRSHGIAVVTVTLAWELAAISMLGEEKLVQLGSGNSVLPSLISSFRGGKVAKVKL